MDLSILRSDEGRKLNSDLVDTFTLRRSETITQRHNPCMRNILMILSESTLARTSDRNEGDAEEAPSSSSALSFDSGLECVRYKRTL